MTKNRDFWIDAVKAICMICVYVYHTGFYYGIDYNQFVFLIKPFYVNGFFFISGYLIFKSYTSKKRYGKDEYIKSLKNIFFRLAIPTIIFSLFTYIPKHYGSIDICNFLINTLGGTSFWFTSAMCVSQIVMTTLFLSNKKNVWLYFLPSILLLVIMNNSGNHETKLSEDYFPWYWQTGLTYLFVMCLGGIFHKYEENIYKCMNQPWAFILLGIAYAISACSSLVFPAYYLGLSGRNNLLGISGMAIAILFLILIAKRIKENHLLQFIGKNSIVFYVLSGAVPIVVSAIANHFIEEKTYYVYALVTLTSLAVSYGITYIITRYMPFILDLRSLSKFRKIHDNVN